LASDVFISHSTADAVIAQEVCAALEQTTPAIRCWIAPRNIGGGQAWPEAIVTGIDESRAIVVVLSRSSNASTEVLREVERASKQRKGVVPFRIEDVEPAGALAYFLSLTQWVDAVRPPLAPRLLQLTESVHLILDGRVAVEVHPQDGRPITSFEEVDLEDFTRRRGRRGRFRRLFEDRIG
jgi:hypothetical protein